MKICAPQLGISPDSILGGEVFDREILLGLAKRKIKIEIILPKEKKHDKNIKNWKIIYLPVAHFPAILANILYLPYIFFIYNKSSFQILRLHQPQFFVLCALIFKIFHPKVKIVATYHQYLESNFSLLSKFINNVWDLVICDSQNVKNKLIKSYDLESSKITVVHNGVPFYLKPSLKDTKLVKKLKLEGKIVFLFMGLFIPRKSPLFLLDVLFNLKRLDVVVLFWGKGPLKEKIVEKAQGLNLADQIRIIDPIYGPEKNKIHNLADIFVHPALDEGFALAPLEAMACAKPVIMTKGYSADEAVSDGRNGYLCEQNDVEDWSKILKKLTSNRHLREKMGFASFKKVKKEFQWRFAVEEYLQVFKKLVK